MPRLKDILIKPQRRHPCKVTALDGETALPFELRLLNGEESSLIEDKARAAAKAAGIESPKPEDGPYLRVRMAETGLAAATDSDSPIDKPEPFFANLAEVRRHLDDARIAYVYQEQRAFQSKFAPVPETASFDEFIQLTWASVQEAQKGGDPERPFVGLPYRKLTSFAMSAASVLTQPTLPALLFGSLIQPGQGDTSDSSSSSTGAVPTASSMTSPQPELSGNPILAESNEGR